MGKDRTDKMKKYIKEDRPARLKSYIKKHRLCVSVIELSKGRSLLHYCSQHGSSSILRYLLKEGVDPYSCDVKGNLPLHYGLRRALKCKTQDAQEVYRDIILPLLEVYPSVLDTKNNDEISCRNLLDHLRYQIRHERSRESDNECDDDDDDWKISQDRWQEKLAEEANFEFSSNWGIYEGDYLGDSQRESHDEWADRIHREHKEKHKYQNTSFNHSTKSGTKTRSSSKTKPDSSSHSGIIDEEKLKKMREEFQKKYEEKRKKEKFEEKGRQKLYYEKKYKELLEGQDDQILGFDDIPWPSKGSPDDMVNVIFCDMPVRSGSVFKKCLRDQQVRWHPDKFMQKFGKRLKETDLDKILDCVKEISQALNKLKESLPS